jgi:hypothetical protein
MADFVDMVRAEKEQFQQVVTSSVAQIRAVQDVIKQRGDAQVSFDGLQRKLESKKQRQASMRGDATKAQVNIYIFENLQKNLHYFID